MRIRFLTNVCLVSGSYETGAVLDCDEAQASSLIEQGLAERDAMSHGDEEKLKKEIETAMIAEAPERATLPRGRGR